MEPHRLTNVNPVDRMAVCSVCGPVGIVSKGWQSGAQRFTCARRQEQKRHAARLGKSAYEWMAVKGLTCERCGFEPEHPIQLDLHNHRSEAERQTLCANCHRLVTYQEGTGGRV